LTHNDTDKFLRFIDKYVKQAVGNHNLREWVQLNGSKMLLDRITPSDITCTIIPYENSVNVWREKLEIKANRRPKKRMKCKKVSKTKIPSCKWKVHQTL
jgi:hypothetical protein